MLSRVVSTLENETTSKAWSITGPYGSGKSAFALYAAKLLGDPNTSTTQQALDLLKRGDVSLHERFISTNGNGQLLSDFCPVLISGERAPLSLALLRGLEHGLISFGRISRSNSPIPKIKNLLKTAEKGKLPHASEITTLFELAMRQVERKGGTGILLVIDELGKFLEYATQHPAQGDMFVLQTLAELADRSEQTPLLLMTILHQAFELYAQRATKAQREEWAKVQGRFEDLAFTEPTEQMLRLVGTALEKKSGIAQKNNLDAVIDLELKPRQLNNKEFIQLLEGCLPLHPTVALLIGPLFRRFAQNERSLFAFLSSSEPHGLQDFLSSQYYNSNHLPMLSLAHLYDYLNAAYGSRLYTSHNGKKWAEIEFAISRLADPCPITIQLIKTIGLLGIAGEVIPNLKASKHLLCYALENNLEEFIKEFEIALATLEKHSIIVYRRHRDAYTIWEGSDIDIEAKLHEAEKHVDIKASLATDLSRYMLTRPFVARRHLFETGTLRYFAIRYTDLENFDANLQEPFNDADGLMLYALPANEHEVKQLIEKANNIKLKHCEEVLISIPRSINFLRDAVTELAYLHWVLENTPELEGDMVARRELSARLVAAEREVSDQLTAIFSGDSKENCTWYHKGQLTNIASERERNEYLSKICDDIYDKSPHIRNELINRRKLSGAATTARKKLIQAMLENGDKKDLGITGYPAEMSIYRSLLWNTRIHCETDGVWEFHPPKSDDKDEIKHTWNAIEDFLETCEGKRQPVVKLYGHLMAPPYGVRSGPLSILLCAVILHYKTEIALYENGYFIADWSMPVFERLLKAPQLFELKRFRITGSRSDLLLQFFQVFNQSAESQTPDLLTVVTPLIQTIAQLPKYTLATQELSGNAKNLRKVVLNAREPDELLFKQLPKVLGFPTFGMQETIEPKVIPKFFDTLKKALSELEQAYEILLNSIEQKLAKAFSLTSSKENLRAELVTRSEPLLAVKIGMDIKAFSVQICSGGHDFSIWLEAIATYLAKKPPASWLDVDKAQFESNLAQLARKFRHFEAVSYEKLKYTESSRGEPIRVGITAPKKTEQERVVILTPSVEEAADQIE
ncbi:hypothetical protein F4167_04015, partial [Candidatus Poribacteria bacterium]|nr:hypothetical protein [Candidatus Poribacteria bacterium]